MQSPNSGGLYCGTSASRTYTQENSLPVWLCIRLMKEESVLGLEERKGERPASRSPLQPDTLSRACWLALLQGTPSGPADLRRFSRFRLRHVHGTAGGGSNLFDRSQASLRLRWPDPPLQPPCPASHLTEEVRARREAVPESKLPGRVLSTSPAPRYRSGVAWA